MKFFLRTGRGFLKYERSRAAMELFEEMGGGVGVGEGFGSIGGVLRLVIRTDGGGRRVRLSRGRVGTGWCAGANGGETVGEGVGSLWLMREAEGGEMVLFVGGGWCGWVFLGGRVWMFCFEVYWIGLMVLRMREKFVCMRKKP